MGNHLARAACLLGLIGLAGTAAAQGVRLGGSVTQTFDLTDNNNLSGGGLDFGSSTGLSVRLSSATPTTRIAASTGVSLSFGSGGGGASLTRPSLNLSFGTDTKHVKYTATASFSKRPAAVDVTQPDLSVLRYTGDETRISGSLGASGQLNSRMNLSLTARAARADYDPVSAGLFPNNTFSLGGRLGIAQSPLTNLGLTATLGLYEAENASNTTSVSADIGASIGHRLDSVTDVSGNLGLAFIETTDTVLGVETTAFEVSALFGAGITRQLPDGSISLSLNQSLAPSASGSLVIDTTLAGSYAHQVNADVSYGIDARIGRQERVGGGPATTFVSVSPSYTRALTRDINATASYFLQRDNTGATSSGLAVSFSRAFDFPL